MAIEPINGVYPRPDLITPRRQDQQAARPTEGPDTTSANAPGTAALQRPNLRLQEAMQTGRETSALLSTLMGPNQMAFQPPTPPAFAGAAGRMANGPLANGPLAAGPLAAGNLPRASAPLLEAQQAGRTTSTLLSALNGTSQPGGSFVSSFAQPVVGYPSGNSLAAMRTAQEVIQAVGTAAPSAQNARIANEAYQMEAQAQQDYTRKAAGGQGTWEWFA